MDEESAPFPFFRAVSEKGSYGIIVHVGDGVGHIADAAYRAREEAPSPDSAPGLEHAVVAHGIDTEKPLHTSAEGCPVLRSHDEVDMVIHNLEIHDETVMLLSH